MERTILTCIHYSMLNQEQHLNDCLPTILEPTQIQESFLCCRKVLHMFSIRVLALQLLSFFRNARNQADDIAWLV